MAQGGKIVEWEFIKDAKFIKNASEIAYTTAQPYGGYGPHSNQVIVPIPGHPGANGLSWYKGECFWERNLGWRVRGSGVSTSKPCLTGPHPWPNPSVSTEPEEWED